MPAGCTITGPTTGEPTVIMGPLRLPQAVVLPAPLVLPWEGPPEKCNVVLPRRATFA